nr:MAG TPA: hypothetical protein [Caudoviricetes sp.]
MRIFEVREIDPQKSALFLCLCLLIPGAKLHFELLEKFQRFNFTFLPSKNRQKLYVIHVVICEIFKSLFFAIVL